MVPTAVRTAVVAWREAEPATPVSVLADRALALLEQASTPRPPEASATGGRG